MEVYTKTGAAVEGRDGAATAPIPPPSCRSWGRSRRAVRAWG